MAGERCALLPVALACLAAAACRAPEGPPDRVSTLRCASDRDCPPELPTCHPSAGICVGCLAGMLSCTADGFTCDEATHTCVPAGAEPGCRVDAECDAPRPRCLRAGDGGSRCVQCLVGDDCDEPTPYCDSEADGGVSYTCKDGCLRCRGSYPVCVRERRTCCPLPDAGGSCTP